MSIWDTELSDDQLNSERENFAQTGQIQSNKKDKPGFFEGSLTSPFRGMAAGFAKTADAVYTPFYALEDRFTYQYETIKNDGVIEPYQEFKKKAEQRRNTLILQSVDFLSDQENSGTLGNIGFSLGDYATRAITGSLVGGIGGAVAVTGGAESNYSYKDLISKGVDSSTALKVAAVDGVVAGASAALPMSYGFKGAGGLVKDAALSIGGATGLSTVGQFASGQILESNNYNEQARKYEITPESIATDVLLNGLFFGAGRYAQSRLKNDIDSEIKSLDVDQLEARNTQIESALEINSLQFEDLTAPVKPSDPIQHNNHLKNLNNATESIVSGRPVKVQHNVSGEDKQIRPNYAASSLPSNAKLIAQKAEQSGVDPSVALTISHIETGGSFNPNAKNPKSSADGLFQILNETWRKQGGGDRRDVNEQIKQGLKHIKNANSYIQEKLGRAPVAHEQYLGHLLGPAGAVKVLKADPSTPLIDIVRKYDKKNADAIVKNNGMSGLTAGQAISKWQQKWNSLSVKYGGSGTTRAYGMDGSSYDFAYEVKSLDDLIASNDRDYGVNPNYPSELQPRDRTREAYRQQIEAMADDLKPELLGESYKLSDGAPIIGMDNIVESGNGRTMAISKAYEQGKGEAYRQFVQDFANTRGYDIEGIDNPVLVRTRLSDVNRQEFAKLANQSDLAQYSATEKAKTDIDRLPDSTLLKLNSDGNINLEQSMDYVHAFVDQLPQSERAAVMTRDGRLSQDGKRRIESAIVQRTYGDSNLVARLSENLDDDSKSVLNALLKAAPQLAQLNDLVKQGGRHQNSISSDLAQAAQKYSDLKANGLPVRDYLNQGQLIDDGLSAGAKDFLNVFESNSRSAKAIGDNIQSKINEIESMGDPRQGSLFGNTPEEKAALDIIMQNPDQDISVPVAVRADGEIEAVTMKLGDYLKQLEDEALQAKQDELATQTAISCALQFG